MGEQEEQRHVRHDLLVDKSNKTYSNTLTPVYGNTVWYLVLSTGCEVSSVVGVESPGPRGRAAGVRKYPGCYTMVCVRVCTRTYGAASHVECCPSLRTPQLERSLLRDRKLI